MGAFISKASSLRLYLLHTNCVSSSICCESLHLFRDSITRTQDFIIGVVF